MRYYWVYCHAFTVQQEHDCSACLQPAGMVCMLSYGQLACISVCRQALGGMHHWVHQP